MRLSVQLFAFNAAIAKELRARLERLALPATHPDHLRPLDSPSDYQSKIFDWIRLGKGSAIVKAVAGSGKTTTILQGIRYIPGLNPADVRASTFHSVGFGAVCKHLGKKPTEIQTDGGKVKKLIRDNLGDLDYDMYGDYVARLVGLAKGQGVGALCPDAEGVWYALIQHHDLFLDAEAATEGRAVELAREFLRRSNEVARNGIIDFDDQLYLPLLWKLRLWQNDWVIVDECLVPDTPILLDFNGTQKTIQQLYDEKYVGPIVTWSPERGSHLGRVVGAKRVPIGKPMVRIRTRQRGYTKDGTRLSSITEQVRHGTRTLVCTADHKIWTANGWIAAGMLASGMLVKHETAAERVRTYQSRYAHSEQGRQSLSINADTSRFQGYAPDTFNNRGGNGHGPTRHERLLLERLGNGWAVNVIVPTGKLPRHYKLDLANLEEMIAVEVDGNSHNSIERQEQDARKDAWLRAQGWTVVRIKNEEVLSLTDELLRERIVACPVDAEVISVEPWINRHHEYVYDLSIEDTHCYFANGLLVHNCQDTNPVRRAIARLALRPGGRLLAVGDARQAIYGFTGASHDALDLIQREFNCCELPLTISYRCPASVGDKVRELVPYFQVADGAKAGVVEDVSLETALKRLTAQDAILCRNTAPLVELAFTLISRGVGCHVLGKEIGDGLVKLIKKQKAAGLDKLLERLEVYRDREVAKFQGRGEENKAEAVQDRVACIMTVADALDERSRTVPALIARLENLFSDGNGVLTLSTQHKAKGREWHRVAILRPDLNPSKWARQDWQALQEENLMYVAWTRAMSELLFLTDDGRGK
jgi:very-short-patch-repair endonuclease